MDDESAVIGALERRAGILRAEIRRIEELVDELRRVEALIAFYRDRPTVPSRAFSLLMPQAPTGRETDAARRNREILAAVRRVLLTQPNYEARVAVVLDQLPEEVRELVGGKDERVAAEILRHRLRDGGDAFGLTYTGGRVQVATDDETRMQRAPTDIDDVLADRIGTIVVVTLTDGTNIFGRLSRDSELGGWIIAAPGGNRRSLDIDSVTAVGTPSREAMAAATIE